MSPSNPALPDRDVCAELYRRMLAIRLAEQKIIELYPTDKIQSPVHLSIGQEAVAAGVCLAMAPQDRLYGTYRSHALYIAKGGDLKKMFAELYARDTGCDRGKGGSMHLAAPEAGLMASSAIVASTIPVATGEALAAQVQGSNRVAVSFFGDGAVDEGVFFESLNFAILKGLPIVYVIENNFYAIHSKLTDRRKQTELHKIGLGLGLEGECHDDAAPTVYASMRRALEAARSGSGPVLIEYRTHRWKEHVGIGSDFKETYRLPGEEAEALKNDPLRKLKETLSQEFKVGEDLFAKWEAEVRREIEAAVAFAEASPFPAPENLHQHVFAPKP